MNERRYDIDALRSIAMFLLIFYHLGISFASLSPYILCVQIKRIADGASIPPDESNTDYQEYLNWVSAGGIPESA